MSADTPDASRASDLAALLAAPLPRTVPPNLRRAALRQSASGGLLAMGVLLGFFGAFFAFMFFPWNFYREHQLAESDTATAPGRVTATAQTNMSVRKTRVFSFHFEFQIPAGGVGYGECYTTGSHLRVGDAVKVRYRPEDPTICCIEGARLNQAGSGGVAVIFFPLLGAIFVASAIVVRRRTIGLLTNGFLAEALVTTIENTRMQINKKFVQKITFQRTDSPDGGSFIIRSYQPEVVALASDRLAANQPVYVLYDPAKPQRALLPEAL